MVVEAVAQEAEVEGLAVVVREVGVNSVHQ